MSKHELLPYLLWLFGGHELLFSHLTNSNIRHAGVTDFKNVKIRVWSSV